MKQERKVPVYPEGRRCSQCDKPLSRYNSGPLCESCVKKKTDEFIGQHTTIDDYLGTDPRGHGDKYRNRRLKIK